MIVLHIFLQNANLTRAWTQQKKTEYKSAISDKLDITMQLYILYLKAVTPPLNISLHLEINRNKITFVR